MLVVAVKGLFVSVHDTTSIIIWVIVVSSSFDEDEDFKISSARIVFLNLFIVENNDSSILRRNFFLRICYRDEWRMVDGTL